MTVVIGDGAADGVYEAGDEFEDAAPDAPSRNGGKERLGSITKAGNR